MIVAGTRRNIVDPIESATNKHTTAKIAQVAVSFMLAKSACMGNTTSRRNTQPPSNLPHPDAKAF